MAAIDIVNQALAEAGAPRMIGDFYEGSPASILAVQIYAQTRDDLLRSKDWPFAKKTTTLTLLKTAGVPPVDFWDSTQPIPPWRFEYTYPDDCVILRALRPDPLGFQGGDSYEPGPIRWTLATDPTQSQKVILTNLEFALGIYTAKITDPNQWEPLFSSALVDELARVFEKAARALMEKPQPDLDKIEEMTAQQSMAEADMRRG